MNRANKLGLGGFTLVELLVTISIIAILVTLLASALHGAKVKAHGGQCLNNHRQLQFAWTMYTDDNYGCLPIVDPNGGTGPGGESWITPDLTNTNTTNLLKGYGSIGPYSKSAEIYKCPSDRSFLLFKGQKFPHVRSVSLNVYMHYVYGDINDLTITFQKIDAVAKYDTSRFFVIVDEHEDTLPTGAGDFTVGLGRVNGSPWLIHLPSARHGNANPLSFADGHVEMHRWVDPRILKPVNGTPQLILCENSKDQQWLEQHATVRLKGP